MDRSAPPRRRSSVAYDPARDTFTEIPDSIPEDAVASPEITNKPIHAQTSPLKDVSRKRERESVERDPAQVATEEPSTKKRRPSPEHTTKAASSTNPTPMSALDLPKVPKRSREEGEVISRAARPAYSRCPDIRDSHRPSGSSRRSQSPVRGDRERDRDRNRDRNDVYRRRSPPHRRTPPRSPSPIRRSPPRDQPRPDAARRKGRNVLDQMNRLQAEREAQQAQSQSHFNRGVQDVSNQFYNQRTDWVKVKGREWRTNESQIKGLRSFNNWIKSAMIQKFSPTEKEDDEEAGWGEEAKPKVEQKPLLVLDMGCGKGGDLGKWEKAPQPLDLYVGLDPAETSIQQANDRYNDMRAKARRGIFEGRFFVQDCFGESIANIGIVQNVGFDANTGSGMISRFGGGGFDVVTMMFSMHYAFESEEKVRMMLKNVAGCLKKGGRFIGVVPNSDALAENIKKWFNKQAKDKSAETNGHSNGPTEEGEAKDDAPSWGNTIYNVRFPPPSETYKLEPSEDGTIQFRPPFGWKYTYWMAEAVDVPEFVVPWEAFRAIAESYNLEQRYRKGFLDIWETEKYTKDLWELAGRMGVIDVRRGEEKDLQPGDKNVRMVMSEEEKEAVGFYHGFCFVKV